MRANSVIKDIFNEFDTFVLNIAKYNISDGIFPITHVVLDGSNIILYSANPNLGEDFQDDDYEQVFVEDDSDIWNEIKNALVKLK